MPPRRLPAAARSRSHDRERVVRWVARKRGEKMAKHELRLGGFFLYLMRLEARRLREYLLTTLARQGHLPAHTHATKLREALMDMLIPQADLTPGSARAFLRRWRRAVPVIWPRGSEGGPAVKDLLLAKRL